MKTLNWITVSAALITTLSGTSSEAAMVRDQDRTSEAAIQSDDALKVRLKKIDFLGKPAFPQSKPCIASKKV